MHIDVPPALRGLSIPCLLVQPLVENAMKHGVAPSVRGGEVRGARAAAARGVAPDARRVGVEYRRAASSSTRRRAHDAWASTTWSAGWPATSASGRRSPCRLTNGTTCAEVRLPVAAAHTGADTDTPARHRMTSCRR